MTLVKGRKPLVLPAASNRGKLMDVEDLVESFMSEPDRERLRERIRNVIITNRRCLELTDGNVRNRFLEGVIASDFTYKIYPCTMFAARYGGAYEGGLWVALHSATIPQEAVSEVELEVKSWFADPSCDLGVGQTPNEAMLALHAKL